MQMLLMSICHSLSSNITSPQFDLDIILDLEFIQISICIVKASTAGREHQWFVEQS